MWHNIQKHKYEHKSTLCSFRMQPEQFALSSDSSAERQKKKGTFYEGLGISFLEASFFFHAPEDRSSANVMKLTRQLLVALSVWGIRRIEQNIRMITSEFRDHIFANR